MRDFSSIATEAGDDVHGVATMRADIAKTGTVGNARVLADLAWSLTPSGEEKKRAAVAKALSRLEAIGQMPGAAGPSVLIASLRFAADSV